MGTRLLQGLSLGLVVAGAGMLAAYGVYRYDGARGQQTGIEDFRAAQAAQAEKLASATTGPAPAGAAEPVVPGDLLPPIEVSDDAAGQAPERRDWSPSRIAAYDALTAAAAEPAVPEGLLRIPSVQLEVPVFSGTGEAALTRGAGHIEGTPRLGEPGNVGIAAHRDGWFRALKDVEVGDAIEVETLTASRRYRITALSVVTPEDVHVLDPTGSDALTLVTCYPFYFVGAAPQRFIVHAEAD